MRAILFDTDGVLALPEKNFSKHYAESRGLDPAPFGDFFKGIFAEAKLGQADLKDLIKNNPDIWHFEGEIDDLIKEWFDYENITNEPLLDVIGGLRKSGIKCYLATSQEKYRAEYLENAMFKDMLDGFFISCNLGVDKNDSRFFRMVLEELKLQPEEVAFFDDNQGNVDVAKSVGIKSFLYTGVDKLKKDLEL